MVESHDESSAESPIRGKDEEPARDHCFLPSSDHMNSPGR